MDMEVVNVVEWKDLQWEVNLTKEPLVVSFSSVHLLELFVENFMQLRLNSQLSCTSSCVTWSVNISFAESCMLIHTLSICLRMLRMLLHFSSVRFVQFQRALLRNWRLRSLV